MEVGRAAVLIVACYEIWYQDHSEWTNHFRSPKRSTHLRQLRPERSEALVDRLHRAVSEISSPELMSTRSDLLWTQLVDMAELESGMSSFDLEHLLKGGRRL